jgi:membrane-bound metal-dependent hydrolase YbcI (DUF457 family)
MTAAHFATALAIKSHVPKASTSALIIGAFIPDFIWIILATAGLEPTKREIFFDDWSHSLLMILVYATLYSIGFWSRGRKVAVAMGLAVFAHFLLDMPVHPKDLALYPYSSVHLGVGLSGTAPMNYWYIQLAVVLVLLAIYVAGTRRLRVAPKPVVSSCVLILGWHIALMPG